MESRYRVTKKVLIFWTLFIGIGAFVGAISMLVDSSGKALGMDAMLPYFQKLPFSKVLFQDFTFSGIALLIVNGITNIISAFLLFKNKYLGIILGGIFGITLMLWICIQFYIFPLNFMSTIYFIFGFCQFITGIMASVFYKQEQFTFDINDYKNIGTSNTLVVYFSRMGYVKKIAYEEANKKGSYVYEIKAKEKVMGTLGFWWCGRFGLSHLPMAIEDIDIALSKFDEVTICSPIWVFSLAAPVRTFCLEAKEIKKVNYILVHYTNSKYLKVAEEMDNLLGIEHQELINFRCRKGKFKKLN